MSHVMAQKCLKNLGWASNRLPEGTIVRLLSTWTQWCGIQLQHGTRERTHEEKQIRGLQHDGWCT